MRNGTLHTSHLSSPTHRMATPKHGGGRTGASSPPARFAATPAPSHQLLEGQTGQKETWWRILGLGQVHESPLPPHSCLPGHTHPSAQLQGQKKRRSHISRLATSAPTHAHIHACARTRAYIHTETHRTIPPAIHSRRAAKFEDEHKEERSMLFTLSSEVLDASGNTATF